MPHFISTFMFFSLCPLTLSQAYLLESPVRYHMHLKMVCGSYNNIFEPNPSYKASFLFCLSNTDCPFCEVNWRDLPWGNFWKFSQGLSVDTSGTRAKFNLINCFAKKLTLPRHFHLKKLLDVKVFFGDEVSPQAP